MTTTNTDSLGLFSPHVLGRSLAIFLPAAVVTAGVIAALYYVDLTNERSLYAQAGKHLVDLHGEIIARELNSVESDLLYLANQALLRDFLSGAASRQELEVEYVLFCRQKMTYDQVRYLDETGQERVRINYNNGSPAPVPEAELQPKAARYYFTAALPLDRGKVFVSPLDLNVEHEKLEDPIKPVIRFATPVFDRQGVKRGVLVLNYLGEVLRGKLSEVSANLPGTALLLNDEGHFLRGRTKEEEWGFMLGHDRTFPAAYDREWAALGSPEGQQRTREGLFTHRRLSYPATASEAASGVCRLIVVSHIPPGILSGRANLLLQRLLLFGGVMLLLLFVLAWYLGRAAALRRRHEQQIAESEGRLRLLSARLMNAQEEERRRLSRDLHDDLGQVVTTVTLNLQRAAQAADPDKKNDLIGHALQAADRLLDHLHELAAQVRPTILDDLGLKDAVQNDLSEYERNTGITTHAELQFEHQFLPAVVSENVYRIMQEALTNVARHARAAEVFVTLRVTGDTVTLAVRDTGVGFTPGTVEGKRLGLLGMRERAELLGGTFAVRSAPGEGTEVRVSLPVRPDDPHRLEG